MLLSLYTKPPLSPSTIKQRLIKRHLLDSSLQKAQIFYYMKKFIDFDIGQQIMNLQQSEKVKIISIVLQTIEKSIKDKTKLLWMKTFAVHAFFKFFILNCGDNKLIIEALLEKISEIKTSILANNHINKSKESQGLISRSLTKIKRSLSTKSLKKMFGVENEQTQHKPLNKLNQVQRQIHLQYVLYLQKLTHDWFQLQPFISLPSSPHQRHLFPPLPTSSKTSLIWKIFNIFKKLSKVTLDYLRIHQLFKDYSIYFYSMMNFISEDVEMLYNPVVGEVRARIKAVVGWGEENKGNRKKEDKELRVYNQKIMEIYPMVQQLGNTNQVVLYVFLGTFHHKYLYKRSKPSSFVSINQSQFDIVYQAVKKMAQYKNKFQPKNNQFQQKDRFNQQINSKIFANKLMLKDYKGTQTERSQWREDMLLMGQKDKVVVGSSKGENNRMKAVNYKSEKLKEMQQEVVKKE